MLRFFRVIGYFYGKKGGGEAADSGAKRRKRPAGARTYAEANEGRRGRTAKPGEGAAEQPPGVAQATPPRPRRGAARSQPGRGAAPANPNLNQNPEKGQTQPVEPKKQ